MAEISVFADLEQTTSALGEYNFTNDFLQSVHFRAGYTDCEHAEVEGGLVGTTFSNETEELRVTYCINPPGWRGESASLQRERCICQAKKPYTAFRNGDVCCSTHGRASLW